MSERNCPFYGRHAALGYFLGSGGNQCALVTDAYSPCRLEVSGDPVEWSQCPTFKVRCVERPPKAAHALAP